MDRKMKHRILGVLVILGLIVIVLPLFQTHKSSTETVMIPAPAFPEQAQNVKTSISNPDNEPMDTPTFASSVDAGDIDHSPSETQKAASVLAETPAPSEISPEENNLLPPIISSDESVKLKSDDIIKPKTLSAAKIHGYINQSLDNKKILPVLAMQKVSKTQAKIIEKKLVKNKFLKAKTVDTALAKLKNPSWVIQLGYFKHKQNALTLLNRLRAKGYHAFIKNEAHNSTRVLVGPAFHKNSAHKLAEKLNKEFQIKGIILNYKPLAL